VLIAGRANLKFAVTETIEATRLCARGLALEQLGEADEDLHHAALITVRKSRPPSGIRDMTNQMMGIARVP